MKCIVCETNDVKEFLDLGETALANKFITEEEKNKNIEKKYSLKVGFCNECSHVQLMEHVSPQEMFDDYLYISSTSNTLKNHLHSLADTIVDRTKLDKKNLIVDVGSNDGTLLSQFVKHGFTCLGIEPAKNLIELAKKNGVDSYNDYLTPESAKLIVENHGRASVITSTNSFPHIPDLNSFMEAVNLLLAEDGLMVIEAHYLVDLIEQYAFDTIYHEHVSYWALRPMEALFDKYNFEIVNVERLALHHGQIRAWIKRKGKSDVQSIVKDLKEYEINSGLNRCETFKRFATKTYENRSLLNQLLSDIEDAGKTYVGYGAPAKGNTLLTFMGMTSDRLKYIADKSPLKQGRYTPGTHIPVVEAESIVRDSPDYVLILAWNFVEEIIDQLGDYKDAGGKFIIPVPEAHIL